MYTRIRLSLTTILLALAVAANAVEIERGNGLEAPNPQRIGVLIEYLSEDERQAGLSEDFVRAQVELRLRSHGIIPVEARVTGVTEDGVLYVRINLVGFAFSNEVSFHRIVYYTNSDVIYEKRGVTWSKTATGQVGSDRRSTFIMENLIGLVDIFINEHIKTNKILVNPAESLLKSR